MSEQGVEKTKADFTGLPLILLILVIVFACPICYVVGWQNAIDRMEKTAVAHGAGEYRQVWPEPDPPQFCWFNKPKPKQ